MTNGFINPSILPFDSRKFKIKIYYFDEVFLL